MASPLVLAHIRASSGSAVQQTNCHPFRHGRWLWMHNGLLRDFAAVKRDLALAVDYSSEGRDELRPFAPGPEPAPGRPGVTASRT